MKNEASEVDEVGEVGGEANSEEVVAGAEGAATTDSGSRLHRAQQPKCALNKTVKFQPQRALAKPPAR